MRKLILFLLLVCAWPASAGYYIKVYSISNGWPGVGWVASGCFLTPSMAFGSLLVNQMYASATVTAWDNDNNRFTVSALQVWNGGASSITVWAYYACSSSPQVATLPAFNGGVTDEAITGNTIASGGAVSGSATPVEVTINETPLAFLDPEQAVGNATEWFALTMIFWAGVWGLRRVYDLFAQNHV